MGPGTKVRHGLALLWAVCAASALAQGVAAQGAATQDIVTVHRVSAALANEMVETAVRVCTGQGYKVSAVVLDMDGVRQAQLRGDGAGIHTLESSFHKAYTAVTFEVDTLDLVEQSKVGPVSTSIAKLPNLLLAQGGVIIKRGAEAIGAIGVGGAPGGDLDTRCARAGVDKVRDRLR